MLQICNRGTRIKRKIVKSGILFLSSVLSLALIGLGGCSQKTPVREKAGNIDEQTPPGNGPGGGAPMPGLPPHQGGDATANPGGSGTPGNGGTGQGPAVPGMPGTGGGSGMPDTGMGGTTPGGGTTTPGGGTTTPGGGTTTPGGGTTTPGGGGTTTPGGGGEWPPAITDYEAAGPFQTRMQTVARTFDMYHPDTDPPAGQKFPVLFWANATGTPRAAYKKYHTWLATHGFVVMVGHSSATGDGKEMKAGMEFVSTDGGPMKGKMTTTGFGTFGHSQGGATSLVVAKDSRVKASIPYMPDCNFWVRCTALETVKGNVFMIGGASDALVPPGTVENNYKKLTGAESAMYGLYQIDHVTWMGSAEKVFGKMSLAWFRLHLMGDENARTVIDGLEGGKWKKVLSQ